IDSDAGGTASRREQKDLRARIEEAQGVAAEALGPLLVAATSETDRGPEPGSFEPGAAVQVRSLGQQGTVLSVSGGEAEVQIGQFKMRLPVEDLRVLSRRETAP